MGRADLVALVVLADFARVRPHARENQGVRPQEGRLPVDEQTALHIHAAGLWGVVFNRQLVHAFLWHRNSPGHQGTLEGQQGGLPFKTGRLNALLVLHVKEGDVDVFVRQRHVLVLFKVQRVGVLTPNANDGLTQILPGVLVLKALAVL